MSEFKRIPPEHAQALRAQGAVVVDIRDQPTYAAGHITGAQHVDNVNIADFIRAADLDAPVIVACYHGNSSQSAAAYLVSQGFSDVYSLDGGFELWRTTYPAEISSGNSQ
ncbi:MULTISPECIES: thiosulfate sulfurtransferase GlpE [Pseudomonas fluorescens group]|uniref:Thiosulfate sulfurtransferase GlpE n=3 Tax=Pseudomonas fluorescens group TaxID=136843 RepID=A0A3M3ZZ64_PSEMA|nr:MULTISPECIES: thiosulfate sulfurtransferase GlpE [Pseudomonas fluorescens group]MCD7040316.1 thiosulfate sulfurtransferase GlpE [Pseudomonas petroselini]MCD7045429.1 thiosulfate sulfurtransferase GlpE [Pseudomonas petroselini]MCD7066481.1 thiosulfate sulfurtransferase GlpE [Pseudomonas petroselini]MCD7081034.1 thiosulfate sulfurtransferase GlpE [Pseudomonas petroselini]OAJ47414.1 sulfurtransferase [Pseudomonas marginalis]